VRTALIVLTLVVVTMAAYGPTRAAGFVYEDSRYAAAAVDPMNWGTLVPVAPSRNLTFAVWQGLWMLKPGPEVVHGAALGLHILNGLLVLWVAWTLLGRSWAWFASELFLLHPLQVQAVSYASGLADVLSCTGILLVSVAGVASGRLWWRVALWIVGLWVAVTAKESGIVVFGLVPVLLWARGWRPSRLVASVMVVGLLVVAVASIRPVVARLNHVLAADSGSPGQALADEPERWAALQAAAIAVHARHLVWPVGLTIDHDVDIIPVFSQNLALMGFLALIPMVWWCRRRPAVAGGIAWIFVALAPRLVVQTPWSYVNEHQCYAAMVGVALAGAGMLKGRT
jgi:hypothetical protein